MYKFVFTVFIALVFTFTNLIFAQEGSLNVQVTGLPLGVDARVLIYRNNVFVDQLEVSGALSLPAGEYIVGAIATEGEGFVPDPPASQRVQLIANQSANLTINYIPRGTGTGGPRTPNGDLVICEVGHTSTIDPNGTAFPSAWIEVFNPTNQPINLVNYQLRSLDRLRDEQIFSLPEISVPQGKYALIRGRFDDILVNGPNLAFIDNGNREGSSEKIYPVWGTAHGSYSGFVELVRAGQSVDYVKWGDQLDFIRDPSPVETNAWSGAAITFRGDLGVDSFVGGSFSRNSNCSDSNQAFDWHVQRFATPGGPNDVPQNAVDEDFDGIPDSAEVSGGTFAGIDLHAIGARVQQKDIFVEVDIMEAESHMVRIEGRGVINLGVLPREEALDQITAVFDSKTVLEQEQEPRLPIKVHFDTGNFFPSGRYNLGQEQSRVPFAESVKLAPTVAWLSNDPEIRAKQNYYFYKHNFMNPARSAIFHYMLMGTTENNNGQAGVSGRAEVGGNDILILLGGNPIPDENDPQDLRRAGGWVFNDTPNELQYFINLQAGVIMHELGHNLGLEHGGFEVTNDKPSYLSIMSYTYLLYGIGPTTGDRIHERHYIYFPGSEPNNVCQMVNSVCSQSYKMDFSHGGGSTFNENSIDEREGIGHGASTLDWDRDGVGTDLAPYRYNVNLDHEVNQGVFVLDSNGNKVEKFDSILRDHNDWDNLKLRFRLDPQGLAATALEEGETIEDRIAEIERIERASVNKSLLNDFQPIAREELLFNRP